MPMAVKENFATPAATQARFRKLRSRGHARRPLFIIADLAKSARRKVQGKKPVVTFLINNPVHPGRLALLP